jgi:5-methyltetrahydrofolate--homocysteine methyltransferase
LSHLAAGAYHPAMTPAELRERLNHGALLLDGGLGSLLIAMGLEQGRAPEWWNLEHPDRVQEVHRRYVEAGSDLVHTNSFGSTPPKLTSAGLDGRCAEINGVAARITRAACASDALVAGDVGPTGRFFPPMGDATEEELERAFEVQVRALAAGGVDVISIETMYDLREARCAVRAACATGLAVLASMTFEAKRRGFFTMLGDPLSPSLQALEREGATVVGFNCSVTSSTMVAMVEEARRATTAPIVAQPNAGQPRPTAGGVVYDADPGDFALDVVRMADAGAAILGGCCGTDPEFIRRARAALDARAR